MRALAVLVLGLTACGRLGFDDVVRSTDSGVADSGPKVAESVFSISAGHYHSCATQGGRLYCWGQQEGAGALGTGTMTGVELSAVQVGKDEDWISVSAGTGVTCATKQNGSVWCWGENSNMLSGNGPDKLVPALVAATSDVAKLSVEYDHACIISSTGALLCWGENLENQLGLQESISALDRGQPTAPTGSEASLWLDVVAGQGHTCAIAADRSLWCWGRNTDFECGLGQGGPMQLQLPTLTNETEGWATVFAGSHQSCAIAISGQLWCWGRNSDGELSMLLPAVVELPTRIGTDSNWASGAQNNFSGCAVKTNGTMWCWGRNFEGQLGLGDMEDRVAPTQVGTDTDWKQPSLGRFHTCASKIDGSMWCSGNGDMVGYGDSTRVRVFTRVDIP